MPTKAKSEKSKSTTSNVTTDSIIDRLLPDDKPAPGEVVPVYEGNEAKNGFGYLDGKLVTINRGKVVRPITLAESAELFFRFSVIDALGESCVNWDPYARARWAYELSGALAK